MRSALRAVRGGVGAALAGALLALIAAPAAAEVVLPQPTTEAYYRLGVLSGGDVALGGGSKIAGNVHANGTVRLGGGSRVEGDVTAVGGVQGEARAVVTGTVSEGAAPVVLPSFDEVALRARADRVVEGDLVLRDAVVEDVLFVAGTVRIQGDFAGDGAVIASGDVRWSGTGTGTPGAPLELSLVAGRDLHLGSGRALRGVLFAGRTVHVAQEFLVEGVVVGGQRVQLGRNGRLAFVDFDQTPPTIAGLVPPDGGIVSTAATEIAASFADDLSGVNPETVVLRLDGLDRTAAATVEAEGVVLPAGETLSEGEHTVELSLMDRSDNTTSAEWSLVVDTVPPTVAFTEPSQPVLWNDPAPRLALAFEDATSGVDPSTLEVSVDGASINPGCTVSAGEAVCAAQELPFGPHTASAEIRDRAGHPATATLSLETRQDLAPPQVSLASPAAGALVPSGTVEVTGTATDDGEIVSLAVNGEPAALDGEAFSVTVEVPEGVTVLEAVAEDATGKRGSAAVLVTVDVTPPAVVLAEPSRTLTNAPEVRVAGEVSDDSPIASVTVAGELAGLEGNHFERVVPLAPGRNVLVVEATDAAGHVGRTQHEIELFRLPGVRILEPPDLSTVTGTTVAVGGIIDDPLGHVVVNGIAAEVFSDGTFVAQGVPLAEGGNVLTARLTASDGAVNTASIHVVRDLTSPRAVVTTPADGSTVSTPTVAVSGLVNDVVAGTVNAQEASVTVNGVAATVRNRTFLATDVPLDLGENLLTVTAVDPSGNVGQATAVVVREEPAGSPAIEKAGGDLQEGVVRAELPAALQVLVLAADGTPLAGRTVAFEEAGGGGHLGAGRRRAAATTDAQGVASVRWTLGRRAGVQRVRANAVGVPGSAVFTAMAASGEAAVIVVDAGNQQRGIAGQPLPRPLVATVTDAGFNRLGGVPVRFDVVKGAGRFGTEETSKVVETDGDGRALATLVLDPEEGVANNVVTARIAALPDGPVAGFTASGRAAGPAEATAVTGVVLDNTSRPVPGVTVRIAGTALSTRTGAEGQFRIEGAPVGEVLLLVDGSTVERPGVWASLEFHLTTIPGRDNDVGMPIFLLPLDVDRGLFVDETTGGVLTVPEVPGLSLEVLPGSVTFPGGSRSGVVSLTVVHNDRVPMVPNFGQQPRLVVTIQPAGAAFDPPAKITYPNVDGLAPGETTELYSFDHELGHFVSIGPGTVSDDGTTLVSDPGVGILKAGWHCGGDPQSSTGAAHDCPVCQRCSGTSCVPVGDGSTCDDGDDCTLDSCKGGECVGTPVAVGRITGVCVVGVGERLTLKVVGNAPDRVKWAAPGGSPPGGRGELFSVIFEEEGPRAIAAACGSSSKVKQVTVGPVCADIDPKLVEVEKPGPPPPSFGRVKHFMPVATYKGCVDTGQWCFALEELRSEHTFAINLHGRKDIIGPDDPQVTADNCAAVIRDFTPTILHSQGILFPEHAEYISKEILLAHERFHVSDFREEVLAPTIDGLASFVAKFDHCTECATSVSQEQFDVEMRRIWNLASGEYFLQHEVRAFTVSNGLYQQLIDGIRARARAEDWPGACQ